MRAVICLFVERTVNSTLAFKTDRQVQDNLQVGESFSVKLSKMDQQTKRIKKKLGGTVQGSTFKVDTTLLSYGYAGSRA